MTPIDRNGQPLSDYLLKILTIIVKKAGGELRIAATDMIDDNLDGLSKTYDRDKKELVLKFISSTTEVIRPCAINAVNESPSLAPLLKPRSSTVQPLQQLMPMDSSSLSLDPPANRSGSTINDDLIAEIEDQRRKEAAARIIANFPGTPVTSPRSQPLRSASSQQPPPRRVQPSFYRD